MTHPRFARCMGEDEQRARGFFDLEDPNGAIPTKCSYCGRKGNAANPLRFDPASQDRKDLARQYLYRSKCRYCMELGIEKSVALFRWTRQ